MIDWMIRGPELATCNCDYGCPCQFNGLPTDGTCRATVAMQIEEGHFGDVDLSGVRWAAVAAWPGAIHEGHGEIQPIVDDSATPEQRDAILKIMSGQETEPMATFFSVFAAMIETVHEPMFKPIKFEADVDNATGHFSVEGVVDARIEPIRNPVSKEPHYAKVVLRKGFEFLEAEFASGTAKSPGPVQLSTSGNHAHLAHIHLTGQGLVR